MNSFQILDKENKAIPINKLDEEAANFWNKVVQSKQYTSPHDHFGTNWYDVIVWNIANQGHECSGWANVVATMMVSSIGMLFINTDDNYQNVPVKINTIESIQDNVNGVLHFYKPYIDLINHWQSKGYKAKQIKS